MKNYLIKMICICLCGVMALGSLAACTGGETPADTTATTVEGTEAVTEATTAGDDTQEATTDAATSAPDETVAETQAPETEAPAPTTPMIEVSFDVVAEKVGDSIGDYFVRNHQADVSWAEDVAKGKVLALTTKSISDANTSDPYVALKYDDLAEAMGYLNVDSMAYPYLVLRVKDTGNLGGHMFSLYAFENNRVNSGTGLVGEQRVRLADTDDWQYIYFDLSSATKAMKVLRLDFENMALADGETLYISSMAFVATKEEAEAKCKPNTYEIGEDRTTLKIMSFNVQTENGASTRFDIRADMLRDMIDQYQPDSIGMQEVTPTWRNYMDTYVFNGSYTGVGEPRTTDASKGLEQSCIFYRSDKYDLLDSGTFWLSDTPDVVGSALEGCNYPRICTYVHLKDKVTGQEYIHMNTHLDHDGANDASAGRKIRLAQETVMLQKLASLPDVPTVITGDFNQRAHNSSGEAYAVYKLMTGQRSFELADGTKMTMNLADSRVHAPENMPEDFTATMTKYHDPNNSGYNPSREPIDYVFYTPDDLQALSYTIRLYDKSGLYLSDHLPVITTFQFIGQEVEVVQ